MPTPADLPLSTLTRSPLRRWSDRSLTLELVLSGRAHRAPTLAYLLGRPLSYREEVVLAAHRMAREACRFGRLRYHVHHDMAAALADVAADLRAVLVPADRVAA